MEQMYLFSVICLSNINSTRKYVTEDLYNDQRKTSTYTLLEDYLFLILFHTL